MNAAVLANKVFRKARGIPARLSARTLSLPPLARHLETAYETACRRHASRLPTLSPADAAIVEAVERDGVHVTSLDALAIPGARAMLEAGRGLAGRYRRMHVAGELKHQDAFQAGSRDVLATPEILTWGLNDRLLDIVECYLRLPVAYDGINIFYTKADGRQVGARKWHRDLEDRRMLKVAVYLNDVGENDGPFQILGPAVPGADSDSGALYPVLTDETMQARLGAPLDERVVTSCVGPAGTVIFADTGRKYHRGKPAVDRDRCAVFFNYFSRVPLRPFFCERGTLSRQQIAALAARMPPRQRECLLWRDALPFALRMIPPSPI